MGRGLNLGEKLGGDVDDVHVAPFCPCSIMCCETTSIGTDSVCAIIEPVPPPANAVMYMLLVK